MKIFPTSEVKRLDAYTMEHEPISSIDLMERAAHALTDAIVRRFADGAATFAIFAGAGNNGGDALAVARMLHASGRKCRVWLLNPRERLSPDCSENLQRLRNFTNIEITTVKDTFTPPALPDGCIIIDGLFGSGLNKPLSGIFATIVSFINGSGKEVVAIDTPSGLMGEDNSGNRAENIVCANLTLTLQQPKLSFFFAENAPFVGRYEILNIGISPQGIADTPTPYSLTEASDFRTLLRPRDKFAHKGNFGHALLVAGSQGMAGASMLAARAALRSGTGLLTIHIPRCNNDILQISVPEAMTILDACDTHVTAVGSTARYTAVAIGPGLRQHPDSEKALLRLIDECKCPLLLDADALNILAGRPEYMSRLPKGSILTPHPKEFDRLAGSSKNSYERLLKAQTLAKNSGACVVLKGAYTATLTTTGECILNSSGNPGMATGGSGDALTGIILALLARGFCPTDAARLGVYVHGAAGDLAAENLGETAMNAGDIIAHLPQAWMNLEKFV